MTEAEWALIEPCLPRPAKSGHPRTTDLREVSDAILHMLHTGCHRWSIPPCFPPSATIQHYFHSWCRNGVFTRMADTFRAIGRRLAEPSEEPTAAATDTQSVKTTESGGPAGSGTGKKAERRKRHIAVDVEGFLIEFAVREASVQDRNGTPAAVLGILVKAPHVEKLGADGVCQGPKLASELKKIGLGSALEIVIKRKDAEGSAVLHSRWVVELTSAWMSR